MEESFATNNTSSSSSESNTPNSPHTHFNNSPSDGNTRKSRATHKRRASGRKKFQETRHPVYHGVRQRNGKWVSELREPNKKTRVWVGTFSCPHMAARAYDGAAFALRGESANLNFPEEVVRGVPRGGAVSNHGERENWAVDGATIIGSSSFSSISPYASSSSSSISGVEYGNFDIEKGIRLFVDEEELFNMHGLMDSMAEGLMVTPPSIQLNGFDWDGMDDSEDLSLWSD